MSVIDLGHNYDVHNVGEGVQGLQFVKKAIDEAGIFTTVQDGTTNMAVLDVLIDRLTYLDNELPDPYTKEALYHCKLAIEAIEKRTAERIKRGVETA